MVPPKKALCVRSAWQRTCIIVKRKETGQTGGDYLDRPERVTLCSMVTGSSRKRLAKREEGRLDYGGKTISLPLAYRGIKNRDLEKRGWIDFKVKTEID